MSINGATITLLLYHIAQTGFARHTIFARIRIRTLILLSPCPYCFDDTWTWFNQHGLLSKWRHPDVPFQQGTIVNVPDYGAVEIREVLGMGLAGRYTFVHARGCMEPFNDVYLFNYASIVSVTRVQ